MRARRTQVERSEETREKLLDAAIQVLVRRGYAGFRVAEVADVAGISRGGQLHHFRTKDALVAAALERLFASVRRNTERKIGAIGSSGFEADHLLDDVVQDAREFFFSDNFVIALDMIMSSGKDAKLAETTRAIAMSERSPTEDAWIARLEDAGLTPEAATDVLWLLWSVVRGLAARALVTQNEGQRERVIDLALQLTREYVESRAGERKAAMKKVEATGRSVG